MVNHAVAFQYPPKDELLIYHYLIVDGTLFCDATVPKQKQNT